MSPQPLSLNLSASFISTISQLYGAEGDRWLSELPQTLAHYEAAWGLVVSAPYPLTYNFVAPAVHPDGREAVLKLSPASNAEFPRETAALELVAGDGAIRLIRCEPGAMLLERARPGTPLRALAEEDDTAATAAAAGVMARYARPAPAEHSFPSVAGWGLGFARHRTRFADRPDPIGSAHVRGAEERFADLLATSGEQVVLHGDLHHDNVLQQGAGWVAIDPKGVVGEGAYETGALLRNAVPASPGDAVVVLERRSRQLAAALNLDLRRVRGWAYAQAVLAQVWTVEDLGRPDDDLARCIEALATVMQGRHE